MAAQLELPGFEERPRPDNPKARPAEALAEAVEEVIEAKGAKNNKLAYGSAAAVVLATLTWIADTAKDAVSEIVATKVEISALRKDIVALGERSDTRLESAMMLRDSKDAQILFQVESLTQRMTTIESLLKDALHRNDRRATR